MNLPLKLLLIKVSTPNPNHGNRIFQYLAQKSPTLIPRHYRTTQLCFRNTNATIGARTKKISTIYYLSALGVLVLGGSYAAVPMYRIFCQAYSYGGTVVTDQESKDLSKMEKIKNRQIKIQFNADRSSSLQWNFKPRQLEIYLYPGETALAFYRAENHTPKPIDGISTYNVIPFEAGKYFNKIQCFCFEEQRLNPGETVELPVFFYIDPEFAEDPKMENIDTIMLSYTFFEAKELPNLEFASSLGHGKS